MNMSEPRTLGARAAAKAAIERVDGFDPGADEIASAPAPTALPAQGSASRGDGRVDGPREWVLEPGAFTALPERPIQELWFELRTWAWKSLAIVSTVPGLSDLDVAEKLVVVGVANTNRRMSLISAEGASVGETDRVIAMIRAAEARGDRVIVGTDSIIDNPAAAPIIRAVNGAVLSVRMGQTNRADVERTVAAITRNRVIGIVTRDR